MIYIMIIMDDVTGHYNQNIQPSKTTLRLIVEKCRLILRQFGTCHSNCIHKETKVSYFSWMALRWHTTYPPNNALLSKLIFVLQNPFSIYRNCGKAVEKTRGLNSRDVSPPRHRDVFSNLASTLTYHLNGYHLREDSLGLKFYLQTYN